MIMFQRYSKIRFIVDDHGLIVVFNYLEKKRIINKFKLPICYTFFKSFITRLWVVKYFESLKDREVHILW